MRCSVKKQHERDVPSGKSSWDLRQKQAFGVHVDFRGRTVPDFVEQD
jgi:hypothetical protein